MQVFIRIIFIVCLGVGLSVKPAQGTLMSSKKAKIVAAACAALLVGNHTGRVVDFVGDNPVRPEKHYDLPVGAGGIRESLENLLARATKKTVAKSPINQKFYVPQPIAQYEYTLRFHLDQLTKEQVDSFVSFVSRNEKEMTGYLSHAGFYGQFVSSRISEHEFFYEIYSLDGKQRISQGYLKD